MGGRPAGVAHQVPAPGPGQAGGGHQPRQQHQELQAEAPARHQEGRCAGCAANIQGDYHSIFSIYLFTLYMGLCQRMDHFLMSKCFHLSCPDQESGSRASH